MQCSSVHYQPVDASFAKSREAEGVLSALVSAQELDRVTVVVLAPATPDVVEQEKTSIEQYKYETNLPAEQGWVSKNLPEGADHCPRGRF